MNLVLGFTMQMPTNLNVLVMGDSVRIQIIQNLEEAVKITIWDALRTACNVKVDALVVSYPILGRGLVEG